MHISVSYLSALLLKVVVFGRRCFWSSSRPPRPRSAAVVQCSQHHETPGGKCNRSHHHPTTAEATSRLHGEYLAFRRRSQSRRSGPRAPRLTMRARVTPLRATSTEGPPIDPRARLSRARDRRAHTPGSACTKCTRLQMKRSNTCSTTR
jgi:hypothetical protein